MNEDTKPQEMMAQGVPDIYFDRAQITTTVFGVNITLALSEPHLRPSSTGKAEGILPTRDLLTVRTSLAHAKLLAMILRKQIKHYERENKTAIDIPQEILKGLDLKTEDW